MIDLSQEAHLVRVNDMQALLREAKQGLQREAVSFRVRMRLVVATRL
jgi:hypothetical protein